MIYAFNFTGSRDLELSELMRKTLTKYCSNLASVESINMDGSGWGNGAGWEPSMMKLKALREVMKKGVKDDDYVLSVDSDVVFCSSEVFSYIHTHGIIGIENGGPPTNTYLGHMRHMSGASIYIRGDIAKKICEVNEDKLSSVRQQFKMYILAENEDIVLSYLAKMVGATHSPLPTRLCAGDFGEDLERGNLSSFYHINFAHRTFLGVPNIAKWDVPRVLKEKGIEI